MQLEDDKTNAQPGKRPKVSVSLITYNHEKYIAACLDSIVSQVTNFDFEIVVSDDCSKDRTGEIVAEYARKYPELIRPINRIINFGSRRNAISTIGMCHGKYIALLEGDDYWVDNKKLQIQADYLDKNPDCAFCYTNNYTFYEETPDKKPAFFGAKNKPPEKIDVVYFIKHNIIIPNNTKMFRREVQPKAFPDYFFDSYSWDWMLHIMQAETGKMGYIDRITLAYRRHKGAVYIAESEIAILLNGIKSATALNKFLEYKYDYRFKNLWWEYHELAFAYLRSRNFIKSIFYYIRFLLSLRDLSNLKIKDDLWLFRTSLFK